MWLETPRILTNFTSFVSAKKPSIKLGEEVFVLIASVYDGFCATKSARESKQREETFDPSRRPL